MAPPQYLPKQYHFQPPSTRRSKLRSPFPKLLGLALYVLSNNLYCTLINCMLRKYFDIFALADCSVGLGKVFYTHPAWKVRISYAEGLRHAHCLKAIDLLFLMLLHTKDIWRNIPYMFSSLDTHGHCGLGIFDIILNS